MRLHQMWDEWMKLIWMCTIAYVFHNLYKLSNMGIMRGIAGC